MVVSGLSFYIPNTFEEDNKVVNSDLKYKLVKNFDRSNEFIKDSNCIDAFELNKSDYLLELIVLKIVRKIDFYKKSRSKKIIHIAKDKISYLKRLIYEANLIMESITFHEVKQFYNVESIEEEILTEKEMLKQNKKLILACFEEGVF